MPGSREAPIWASPELGRRPGRRRGRAGAERCRRVAPSPAGHVWKCFTRALSPPGGFEVPSVYTCHPPKSSIVTSGRVYTLLTSQFDSGGQPDRSSLPAKTQRAARCRFTGHRAAEAVPQDG